MPKDKIDDYHKVGILAGRGLAGFWTGPYNRVIPAKERDPNRGHEGQAVSHRAIDILKNKDFVGTGNDYLGALKKIIINNVDQDHVYGLTDDELVPLPFDAPKAWQYLIDFFLGTYQVAQATIVLFIAILVDNDQRGLLLGNDYKTKFLPIVRALVILYPACTLVIMTLMNCEVLFRKFMYYRLLSLRILVDWENRKFYAQGFFYYFIATWILLNVWCISGVVQFWDRGTRSGADTTSFATFIVVNLQTLQLLLVYIRLLKAEQRLVSLNAIFERAPVEAQMLLTYTYVIEEQVLIDECTGFGILAWIAFKKRMLNLCTCCLCGKDWGDVGEGAKFDIENLKGGAGNFEEVEDNIAELKEEIVEEAKADKLAKEAAAAAEEVLHAHGETTMAERTPSTATTTVDNPVFTAGDKDSGAPPFLPPPPPPTSPPPPGQDANGDQPAAGAAAHVAVAVGGAEQPATVPAGQQGPSMQVLLRSEKEKSDQAEQKDGGGKDSDSSDSDDDEKKKRKEKKKKNKAKAGERKSKEIELLAPGQQPPADRVAGTTLYQRKRRQELKLTWVQQQQYKVHRYFYRKFYGTIHAFYTAVLIHFPTWPYRRDVPYFRMLLAFELGGLMSVGAIVVFGIMRATSGSGCASLNKQCQACYDANQLYQGSCTTNWSIMRSLFPPPAGGR